MTCFVRHCWLKYVYQLPPKLSLSELLDCLKESSAPMINDKQTEAGHCSASVCCSVKYAVNAFVSDIDCFFVFSDEIYVHRFFVERTSAYQQLIAAVDFV